MADEGSAAPGVRTFLIADVRGYTAFTQASGDEAAARLAERFGAVCREQVEARAGRVVELRGDEALCVFDSPRQALGCAVDLQRRFADELRADPTLPLRVGIGIDAGEAVPVEGGYRGGALNLAARLCSMAEAGQVLVSEGVVMLARKVEGLAYADRGRVSLKGLREPVRYYAAQFDLDLPQPERGARRRWTSGRLAAVAIGTIAVAAALVAVAASQLDGSGAPGLRQLDANVVGELDTNGVIRGQVPLSGRPAGVAAGAGSVWVTDQANDEVVRIDPRSGAVSDTIPSGVAPAGIAVGGGRVWVANSASNTVTWFASGSPTHSHSIAVGTSPDAVAYGSGAAWVVNAGDGTLQRIGAGSLKLSRPIPVGPGPTAVSAGGGSVWVVAASTNEVLQVDARSLQVVRQMTVGNSPSAIVYGGGSLWVANAGDGTVTRISPGGGAPRVIAGVGSDPEGLAFGGGALWVADGIGQSIVRIDPQTDTVTRTTPISAQAAGVTFGGDRVWVAALAATASHRGGTLRAEVSSGPDSLDPGMAFGVLSWALLRMTNDGLVAFREAGGPGGGQIVPDLAVALPVVSADGRTYTFRLRRGIAYSNGSPVRASDFVTALLRQFHTPGAAGPSVAFMGLVGATGCIQKPQACTLRRGVQADNETGTVTYHLVKPDPAFLVKLALPFGDAVPPGAPAPTSTSVVPATGPYVIRHYTPRGASPHAVLVRNPRFRAWSPDAQAAGFPAVIRLAIGVSNDRQLTDVERGKADVMLDQPPPGRLSEVATRYAPLSHVYSRGDLHYLFLDTRRPPFNNLDARRAVDFAVDRSRLLRLFLGSTAAGDPTCQVLPPNMPGYRPYCPYTLDPGPSGAWSAPDLATARRLVKESGTAGDPVLVPATGQPDIAAPIDDYLLSMLRSLGYRAGLRRIPASQSYYTFVTNPHNQVQIGGSAWSQDYAHPYDFLGALFACGQGFNLSQYCDPRYDRILVHALATDSTDPSAASAIWHQADRYLVDSAAAVPIATGTGRDVIAARVGNYQHNPEYGIVLDQLWVR